MLPTNAFLLHDQIPSMATACSQTLEMAGGEETRRPRETLTTFVSLFPLVACLCLRILPHGEDLKIRREKVTVDTANIAKCKYHSC